MADRTSKITDGSDKSPRPGAAAETISFEDAALLKRCRNGDMQAFGALVAKYQDRVFNLIFRMCGNRTDAEELAQEAFLKALEKINQFRGQSGFYTWLFRIAANLTISHRRRQSRVRFRSLTPAEQPGDNPGRSAAEIIPGPDPGPQAAVMTTETNLRVTEALESLEEDLRLIILLRELEEMDYAGIAGLLGVRLGTVKSRLHRARSALKEKLADLV